jgi:tetratricopeptide (TPR) repeat protein
MNLRMKNKQFIILFIFCLLSIHQAFSQTKSSDFQLYLDSAINASDQDSSTYLFDKALNLAESENQQAIVYFKKGKFLFRHSLYNESKAVYYKLIDLESESIDSIKVNSYLMLGGIFASLSKEDSMNWAYSEVKRLAKEPRDSPILARIENSLGFFAENHSDFQKALKHYTKAAKLTQQIGDSATWSLALYNIAYINQELDEFSTTRAYLQNALDASPQNSDSNGEITFTTIQLGFSDYYLKLNQVDSAFMSISKADSVIKKHQLVGFDHYINSSLGDIFFAQEKLDKSELFYKKALDLYTKSGYLTERIETGIDLAKLYNKSLQVQKGLSICQETLKILDTFESNSLKKELLEKYNQLLQQSGDYKKAVVVLEEAYTIEKELWSTEKTKSLAELQTKYETEKKAAQIEKLSQEKEQRSIVFSGIVIGLILLVLVIIFFFRQKRLQSQYLTLDSEQKFLRTQMNPHFIFNALTAIQFYVLKNEAKKSVFYISTFAKLMRQVLNNSQDNFVSLEEEIDTLKNYLELQKVRFQDKFDYQIEIDPDLEIDELAIPPMFAQPFIENSLEHGIKHKEEKGNIKIKFYQQDKKYLVFEVEDDGIGLDKSEAINAQNEKKHQSMATKITNSRIKLLNKRFNLAVKFDISPIKDEKNNVQIGTKVWFLLPFKYL